MCPCPHEAGLGVTSLFLLLLTPLLILINIDNRNYNKILIDDNNEDYDKDLTHIISASERIPFKFLSYIFSYWNIIIIKKNSLILYLNSWFVIFAPILWLIS